MKSFSTSKKPMRVPCSGSLFLLSLVCAAVPRPLPEFGLDKPGGIEAWNHKSNTAVQVASGGPAGAEPVLRFTVDPSKFPYGWVNRTLPEADYANLAGIHGSFRAPKGRSGKLLVHFILGLGTADGPSYFGAEAGRLEYSNGEWTEFYLALRDFRWERGPIRRFAPAELTPNDRLQFMVNLNATPPVTVELARLRFVSRAEGAVLAHEFAARRRRRLLLPPGEAGGPPHPRLLLTPEAVRRCRVRTESAPRQAEAFRRLTALAEDVLAKTDPGDPLHDLREFVENTQLTGTPWRAAYEGRLRDASWPIETVGAVYRLTGDRRFGDFGARMLTAAAGDLTVDDQALGRSFYYTRTFFVRALAFGYDWLWDRLSPKDRRTVQAALLGFVEDIFEHSRTGGWARRPLSRVWNYAPGLMSACGIAVLALEGETRTGEQALLFDCRRVVRDYLTLGVDFDGCGHEGPGYFGYGMGAAVAFAEVLRRQGRGDLFTETNYQLIPPWLVSETLPGGGRWNNLSDCGHGQAPWPAYMYACGRLAELAHTDPAGTGEKWNSPSMRSGLDYLQHFREAPGPRRLSYGALAGLMSWVWQNGPGRRAPSDYNAYQALGYLLYYRESPPVDDPTATLALGLHFRGRGLVVCRSGFGPDDLHLAIEAGPHASGHDQADKGTFTLSAYGADLAIDSGYGNDGDPGKSSSSFAHNVVLIDGRGQPMRYHNQSNGFITGFVHAPAVDWVRVDARDAWSFRYDRDWAPIPTRPVRRAERHFVLVRPGTGSPPYLVIYDDIRKDDKTREYTWQLHVPDRLRFATRERPWRAAPRQGPAVVLTSTSGQVGGSARFRFRVPIAGRYAIYGFVRAAGVEVGKSDSFFVQLDGGERLLWDLRVAGSFRWSAVRDRDDGEEARVFALGPGEHVLTLSGREPDAELARLLVQPADKPPPLTPDAASDNGVLLSADAAAAGRPPLLLRPPQETKESDATLEVFPVHPARGEVHTDWFQTSREGVHPRLQYTVRAVDPYFLMVLLPRRKGLPRPRRVAALEPENGCGVRIEWENGVTDRVVFAENTERQVEIDGLKLHGAAAFVRSSHGKIAAWGAFDARRLEVDRRELFRTAEPSVRAFPP
ncbi:MAG: hypothetical protein GXP31_04985 [Kiritimatiellaeota bacterium]|nr:hypothetical protein [Kiritimatiellota bacterium]